MNTATLQQYLPRLAESLAVVGVPSKSLDDLRAVSEALAPFKDLDLEQLADFLRRASEFHRTGEVPAISVPGLDAVTGSARSLSEAVLALGTVDAASAAGIEGQVAEGKRRLQAALGEIAGSFGTTVKFTDDKKWLPWLRAKGEVARTVAAFRRVAPQITSPESYQSDAIKSAIDELGAADAKVLKAAAVELGASGSGSGKKFVESLLVKLTGIDNKPPKVARKPKREEPTATDEQVDAMARSLEEMVARAKDPNAVADSEIDAILARVSAEFSTDQQKAIAKRVTGQGGRSAQGAIDNLRADLTAVKRLVESQKV